MSNGLRARRTASLAIGDLRLRLRPPRPDQVQEAARLGDAAAARDALLRGCIVSCRRGGRRQDLSQLAETEIAAIVGALEQLIAAELRENRRILYHGEHALAFVPACARYPYEVWVAPIKAMPSFAALNSEARADLARAL